MTENQTSTLADAIRDARERLGSELRAQAEHILKLSEDVAALQLLHGRTEQEAARQWDELARAAAAATEAADIATKTAAHAAAAEAAAAATAAANAAVAAAPRVSPDTALENVLTAIRSLTTCTLPEQLFEVVTEEAARWGVRAAIFDVRGKAAWGASAHGFPPAVTDRVVRSLIVQLNQDNPFRQVCETAAPVEASAETLRKNRNVLDRLKPVPHAPILLLPIRSAGTVSAILYADSVDAGQAPPANGLKILAEFAGAQIDRLIALSGGGPEEGIEEGVLEAAERDAPVEEAVLAPAPSAAITEVPAEPAAPAVAPVEPAAHEVAPAEVLVDQSTPAMPAELPATETHAEEIRETPQPAPAEPPPVEAAVEAAITESAKVEAGSGEVVAENPVPEPEVHAPIATPEPPEFVPPAVASEPAVAEPAEAFPPPLAAEPMHAPAPAAETAPLEAPPPLPGVESFPPAAVPAEFDITQLSESDQKLHKDAKRFARILVSEIELYNKTKVVDGRQNHDLYKRLKSDIDRSRQTYDKRFGKVLDKHFDYFHDELVKALAMNDPALLGPEYPVTSRETPQ